MAGLNGRTVLNGTLDPSAGTGVDGDFFINTATDQIFGPKAAGTWPAGVSLVGPEGPAGSTTGWALTGNANAVAGNSFLGTTNSVPLEFRVNSLRAGYVDPTNANTALGMRAFALTSGNNNTAIGSDCLTSVAGAGSNTGVGSNALKLLQTGLGNTAFGTSSLSVTTNSTFNSGFGAFTLLANTSGQRNTAIGGGALLSNTTGSWNTSVGQASLASNTTGYSNVAVGTNALALNTVKYNLVAVGDSALFNNGVGAGPNSPIEGLYPAMFNTAVGSKSLYANTIGNSNTALGRHALIANTGGSSNTASGASALGSNTFGTGNTAIGNAALVVNVTGSNNTSIGNQSGNNAATNPSNFTALGFFAGHVGSNSNTVEIGNTSVTYIGGQVGFSSFSDGRVKNRVQENVSGLDFIMRLRPVTYHFDLHKQNEMVYGTEQPGEWDGMYDLEHRTMTGFIAQEVEAAAKASNYDFSGVHAPEGNSKLYSLTYSEFVVPLVKAVQEQQSTIEEQQRQIEELRRQVEALLRR